MVDFEVAKSFFPGLEETEIHKVADTMTDRFLKRGTTLVHEGERDLWVVFVVSGLLKGVRVMDSGAEMIECIQMSGDIFFAGASISEDCAAECSFQAGADSLVYLIPKNIAHQLIDSSLPLMRLMSSIMLRNSCVHRDLHVALTTMDAKKRYAWFLEAYPGAVDLMKQYEIASLLGVTPEHLSNVIRAQKNEVSAGNTERESADASVLQVNCFGDFAVFDIKGAPVKFHRSRSMEVLAYLIDRRGADVTYAELMSVLYKDRQASKSLSSQLRTLVSDLMQSLRAAGAEEAVVQTRGRIAVCPERIDCGSFDCASGRITNARQSAGSYLCQYSWAEESRAALRQMEQ